MLDIIECAPIIHHPTLTLKEIGDCRLAGNQGILLPVVGVADFHSLCAFNLLLCPLQAGVPRTLVERQLMKEIHSSMSFVLCL
jgi:hypothetical protein